MHADRTPDMDRDSEISTAVISFMPILLAAGCMVHIWRFGTRVPIPQERIEAAQDEFVQIAETVKVTTYSRPEEGGRTVQV